MGVWEVNGEIEGLLFQGLDGQLYVASFHPNPDCLGLYWFVDEVRLEWL